MPKLYAPNGARVEVADDKVEALLKRGFTKTAAKPAAKKTAAKPAASE